MRRKVNLPFVYSSLIDSAVLQKFCSRRDFFCFQNQKLISPTEFHLLPSPPALISQQQYLNLKNSLLNAAERLASLCFLTNLQIFSSLLNSSSVSENSSIKLLVDVTFSRIFFIKRFQHT